MQVIITDFLATTDALEPERRILAGVADVHAFDAHQEEELAGRIEQADAIILYHNLPALSAKTIARLERCKLIVRGGVGYDNVDGPFARSRDIPVANVPDYGTEEVADSAIGLALALTRGIAYLNSRLRDKQGPWMYHQARPLHRLRGRVFGIIGLGRIGSGTAVRAKSLGMDVVFYDPFKPDGFDKALGVRRAETLEELLERSFVLSIHCPLTEQTRRMVNGAAVARMRPGSYLVNTARGAIVDTSILPEALASGQLAGVGIDVLPDEPPREGDIFITAWRDPGHAAYHRAIVNPHAAFYSEEGLMDIRVKSAEACLRALSGRPVRNVVN